VKIARSSSLSNFILEAYKEKAINLEALFTGDNPFDATAEQ
jgi:hypothetical protein